MGEKMPAFLHCFNEKFKPGDIFMCVTHARPVSEFSEIISRRQM